MMSGFRRLRRLVTTNHRAHNYLPTDHHVLITYLRPPLLDGALLCQEPHNQGSAALNSLAARLKHHDDKRTIDERG